jgi:hypothetical protein
VHAVRFSRANLSGVQRSEGFWVTAFTSARQTCGNGRLTHYDRLLFL